MSEREEERRKEEGGWSIVVIQKILRIGCNEVKVDFMVHDKEGYQYH